MREVGLFGNVQMRNMIVPSIPYMGSKRKLATKILNTIYDTVGDFETLYDLFGGGGAVSIAGIFAGHKVVYNDLDGGVANLMRHVVSGGELPTKWIGREEFKKYKDGDSWYSGFIKCVWSFGNNQKNYLFGRDIEDIKRLAHLTIVNKDEAARRELSEKLNVEVPRIRNKEEFADFINRSLESQSLESVTPQSSQLWHLQQLVELTRLQRLKQLQNISRRHRLGEQYRSTGTESLLRLEIQNKSYDEVEIGEGVIYCDPPYQGTAEYQKTIDHDKFHKWCAEHKSPVFISGYSTPEQFIEVGEFEHTSTLGKNKKTLEKLYWNGRGDYIG